MAVGILAGIICGLISGLGIGGGSILMVWMTAVAGLAQRTAQGINLLFFLPTAASALCLHVRNRLVEKKVAVPAAIMGCITAALGAMLAQNLDERLLRKLFGIFLLPVGISEIRKAFKKSRTSDKSEHTDK